MEVIAQVGTLFITIVIQDMEYYSFVKIPSKTTSCTKDGATHPKNCKISKTTTFWAVGTKIMDLALSMYCSYRFLAKNYAQTIYNQSASYPINLSPENRYVSSSKKSLAKILSV